MTTALPTDPELENKDDDEAPEIQLYSYRSRSSVAPIAKLSILNEMFDMLKYISTSPTIIDEPLFSADVTVELLRNVLENEMSPEKRGQMCGEILCCLSETQRILVRKTYVGADGALLLDALNAHFKNETLAILTTLCQSRAKNDAMFVQKCILNDDYATINQILLSSTNLHLEGICRAYESKFKDSLVEKVKELVGNRHHTYHKLITAVINGVRIECHPSEISVSEAKKDTELLFQMLEKKKSFDKVKVVDLFVHESWLHISEIAKHYMLYSKFDISTRIEKQFGDNSFTFNALHTIIDVSRSRHEYFAQCLQKSMGLDGTSSSDMLFRVMVGRSCIDLGEICEVFNKKYADGKSLQQLLRDSTSGIVCKMLCKLANIRDVELCDNEQKENNIPM